MLDSLLVKSQFYKKLTRALTMIRIRQAFRQLFSSCIFICCFLVATGCSTRGVQEYASYREAFRTTHEASQLILDRFAVAERKVFLSTDQRSTEFNPINARYYVDDIDPPIAASLRQSFAITNAYTEALGALASGESAKEISKKITEIGTLATTAGVSVAGLTGSAQLVSAAAEATKIVDPLKAMEPLVEYGFTIRTRKEFRDRLLQDYETIDATLIKMSDVTVPSFELMKWSKFLSTDMSSGSLTRDELAELRSLMANWVILIEKSRTALKGAKIAVETESLSSSITDFTIAAQELDAAAQGVRKNIAAQGQ